MPPRTRGMRKAFRLALSGAHGFPAANLNIKSLHNWKRFHASVRRISAGPICCGANGLRREAASEAVSHALRAAKGP
ncbi:sensor kinase domain protein [Burkholderia mallei]|nr:sensor kinase domain protein [Burkholderia mallei]KOS92843.1 sensor kinase domain protein [Burkholderia mallei]KOT10818.1 sensor kinase domain protein [Burkholderia mallei]KOT22382.1 sensor kinase domain protein [Burkholderia mallei]